MSKMAENGTCQTRVSGGKIPVSGVENGGDSGAPGLDSQILHQ